jgi:hypothetical protein
MRTWTRLSAMREAPHFLKSASLFFAGYPYSLLTFGSCRLSTQPQNRYSAGWFQLPENAKLSQIFVTRYVPS